MTAERIYTMPMAVRKAPPAQTDDFHISLAEFDLNGRHLGSGSFTQVSLIKRYYDQKNYALKVVDKKKATKNRAIGYVVTERRVMIQLSHPHIIRLRWTAKDDVNVYFIYEYARRGELWTFLQKLFSDGQRTPIPFDLIRAWGAQILSVLWYIHARKNLSHRDLKPENILLAEDFGLLVADFGTSKFWSDASTEAKRREQQLRIATRKFDASQRHLASVDDKVSLQSSISAANLSNSSSNDQNHHYEENPEYADTPEDVKAKAAAVEDLAADKNVIDMGPQENDVMTDEEHRRRSIAYQVGRNDTFTGTAQYMPPEVINAAHPTSVSAGDMWALGVILFQLATGCLPYNGKTDYLVFQKTLEGDRDFLNILAPKDEEKMESEGNSEANLEAYSDLDSNPKTTKRHLRDLIDWLMSVDPTKRPTSHFAVLSHPFFQSIVPDDIKNLLEKNIALEAEHQAANQDIVPDTNEGQKQSNPDGEVIWDAVHQRSSEHISAHRPFLDEIDAKKYVPRLENEDGTQEQPDESALDAAF